MYFPYQKAKRHPIIKKQIPRVAWARTPSLLVLRRGQSVIAAQMKNVVAGIAGPKIMKPRENRNQRPEMLILVVPFKK